MPVVRVKSVGARTDGEGDGSDVRCGFCESAASSGALLAGGVSRVISIGSDIFQVVVKVELT